MNERATREAGFTLIELLVSMLVMLLVLMVTNGLLVESLRIFSNSGRELREPGTELALRLLRDDLHASLPLSGVPFWSHAELPCHRPGRIEVWEMDGNRLVRRSFDPSWNPLGVRPMLDQIVTFRWRTISPGVVEVEVVRRKPAGASALRVATAAWRSVGDTLEAAQVVAGSRIKGTGP